MVLALIAATGTMAADVVDPRRGDDIVVTGTRTECSDDYAVKPHTTTRMPLSQHETPQSEGVVTRATTSTRCWRRCQAST